MTSSKRIQPPHRNRIENRKNHFQIGSFKPIGEKTFKKIRYLIDHSFAFISLSISAEVRRFFGIRFNQFLDTSQERCYITLLTRSTSQHSRAAIYGVINDKIRQIIELVCQLPSRSKPEVYYDTTRNYFFFESDANVFMK